MSPEPSPCGIFAMNADEPPDNGHAPRIAPSSTRRKRAPGSGSPTGGDFPLGDEAPHFTVRVCTNQRPPPRASCAARGAADLIETAIHEAARHGIAVTIERSVCLGYCQHGPNLKVVGGAVHHRVSREDIAAIVRALKAD